MPGNTTEAWLHSERLVAVLWEEGNKAGALAVEKLWNNLIDEKAFHLHCAAGMLNSCESHSYIHGVLTQAV